VQPSPHHLAPSRRSSLLAADNEGEGHADGEGVQGQPYCTWPHLYRPVLSGVPLLVWIDGDLLMAHVHGKHLVVSSFFGEGKF